jgi:hypothetical protein
MINEDDLILVSVDVPFGGYEDSGVGLRNAWPASPTTSRSRSVAWPAG